MTFDAWWELFGCRIVGDPVDYARAAFEAASRPPRRFGDETSATHLIPLAQPHRIITTHGEIPFALFSAADAQASNPHQQAEGATGKAMGTNVTRANPQGVAHPEGES